MFPSKALQHLSKSHVVNQVFAAVIQDRPFEGSVSPQRKSDTNLWTQESVLEVLRSIPKYLFCPPGSIGIQKGFRHRVPLKQRRFNEEDSSTLRNRDPRKLELGLRKAHEFYEWVQTDFGFVHDQQTCKEMLILLAKGCFFTMDPFWEFLRRVSRKGLLSTNSMTSIIKALGQEGLVNEAFAVFQLMKRFPGCTPDVCAYNTVIYALCGVGFFNKAKFLFKQMQLPGFRCPPDKFTYTVLISCCCKQGMKEGFLNAITKKIWQANNFFRLMLFEGFIPDVVTYNCLINGCCKTYRIGRALELFEDMAKRGCVPNRVTYNSFIRYFSAVNEVDKAIEMLRRMEESNHGIATTSSYTPIIHVLCEVGRVAEAWKYLAELVEKGSIPREYTYNLVCDSLKSSGEISLLDRELCDKIEEGIASRIHQVMKVKPIVFRWR